MPRPQGRRVGHQRVARGAVDDVGEEHRQRALPVVRREVAERGRDSRTRPAGPRRAPVPRAPRGARAVRAPGPRSAAPCRRRPSGRRCRRAPPRRAPAGAPPTTTDFEPRHAVHLGGEQPARVDHDQHLLPPLVLVLPRDRLAAAGGGLPVDDAGLVARAPTPGAPRTAGPRPAGGWPEGPASRRRATWSGKRAERRVRHRGIHGGRPGQRAPCPAATRGRGGRGPAPPAAPPIAGAAPERHELEPLVEPLAGRHGEPPGRRVRPAERIGQPLAHLEGERAPRRDGASGSAPRPRDPRRTPPAPRASRRACAAPACRMRVEHERRPATAGRAPAAATPPPGQTSASGADDGEHGRAGEPPARRHRRSPRRLDLLDDAAERGVRP